MSLSFNAEICAHSAALEYYQGKQASMVAVQECEAIRAALAGAPQQKTCPMSAAAGAAAVVLEQQDGKHRLRAINGDLVEGAQRELAQATKSSIVFKAVADGGDKEQLQKELLKHLEQQLLLLQRTLVASGRH